MQKNASHIFPAPQQQIPHLQRAPPAVELSEPISVLYKSQASAESGFCEAVGPD